MDEYAFQFFMLLETIQVATSSPVSAGHQCTRSLFLSVSLFLINNPISLSLFALSLISLAVFLGLISPASLYLLYMHTYIQTYIHTYIYIYIYISAFLSLFFIILSISHLFLCLSHWLLASLVQFALSLLFCASLSHFSRISLSLYYLCSFYFLFIPLSLISFYISLCVTLTRFSLLYLPPSLFLSASLLLIPVLLSCHLHPFPLPSQSSPPSLTISLKDLPNVLFRFIPSICFLRTWHIYT